MNISEHINNYKRRGFVVIRNFFKADDIDQVKNLINNVDFAHGKAEVYFENINGHKKLRRVENLSREFKEFHNFVFNKSLLEYLSRIFDEEAILFKEKLIRIFIHGFLHLLNFDHIKNKDYIKMLREEKRIYQSVISKLN